MILFRVLTTIMLINLLIAMMSHTYDNVKEQCLIDPVAGLEVDAAA